VVEFVFLEENQVLFAEVVRNLAAGLKHPFGPGTHYALHSRQHAGHMQVVEKDVFSPKFSDYTTYTPHVDFEVITDAQYDFRSSITS
jgi:hypothetical protein